MSSSSAVLPDPLKAPSGAATLQRIILPDPVGMYRRRAERLRALAACHDAERYLAFAAAVAGAQCEIASRMSDLGSEIYRAPFHIDRVKAGALVHDIAFLRALEAVVAVFMDAPQAPVRQSAEALFGMDWSDAAVRAVALLRRRFAEVPPGEAVLLWAALGLVWSQRAAALTDVTITGQPGAYCPLCGAMPVGSLILDGAQDGLRYLHCALCEARWHRVRARCSNCDDPRPTELWGVEEAMPAIQAESCHACCGYLKRFAPGLDASLEIVADDLASFDIDMLIEEQGYGRTGINPLSLPVTGAVIAPAQPVRRGIHAESPA